LKNDLAKLDQIIAQSSDKVEKGSTEALNDVRQGLLVRRDTVRTELEAARAGQAVMEQTVAQLEARLDNLPTVQTDLRALDREYVLAQEKYNQLMLKRAQASVSEATAKATPSSLRVVEYAAPGELWWPRMKILYPAALAVGLVMGLALAQLRSLTSGRVRRQDLERAGKHLVYGAIPLPVKAPPLALAPRAGASSTPSIGQAS
jgi:uncharacterized protein involved in exopolysaccharide biosynthesis